jgi:hypothetical protein
MNRILKILMIALMFVIPFLTNIVFAAESNWGNTPYENFRGVYNGLRAAQPCGRGVAVNQYAVGIPIRVSD